MTAPKTPEELDELLDELLNSYDVNQLSDMALTDGAEGPLTDLDYDLPDGVNRKVLLEKAIYLRAVDRLMTRFDTTTEEIEQLLPTEGGPADEIWNDTMSQINRLLDRLYGDIYNNVDNSVDGLEG